MNNQIPPQLNLPDMRLQPIRNGSRGIVFRIADRCAAKVRYEGDCFKNIDEFSIDNDDNAHQKLIYEYTIAKELYKKNISVPTPISVKPLRLFLFPETKYPAFFMSYVPYPTGAELSYTDNSRALILVKKEVSKAVDLGFYPGKDHTNPNNYHYDRVGDRIILIDFEFWESDTLENIFKDEVEEFS